MLTAAERQHAEREAAVDAAALNEYLALRKRHSANRGHKNSDPRYQPDGDEGSFAARDGVYLDDDD